MCMCVSVYIYIHSSKQLKTDSALSSSQEWENSEQWWWLQQNSRARPAGVKSLVEQPLPVTQKKPRAIYMHSVYTSGGPLNLKVWFPPPFYRTNKPCNFHYLEIIVIEKLTNSVPTEGMLFWRYSCSVITINFIYFISIGTEMMEWQVKISVRFTSFCKNIQTHF